MFFSLLKFFNRKLEKNNINNHTNNNNIGNLKEKPSKKEDENRQKLNIYSNNGFKETDKK